MEPGSQPILHPAFLALALVIVVSSGVVMAARDSVGEEHALSLGLVRSACCSTRARCSTTSSCSWCRSPSSGRDARESLGAGLVARIAGTTILLTGIDSGYISLSAESSCGSS